MGMATGAHSRWEELCMQKLSVIREQVCMETVRRPVWLEWPSGETSRRTLNMRPRNVTRFSKQWQQTTSLELPNGWKAVDLGRGSVRLCPAKSDQQ